MHVVSAGRLHIVYVVQHPHIFTDNMCSSIPDVTVFGGNVDASSVASALYFVYGTAMLGVTGFESASSQYVEEQAAGIITKTLRNMWVLSCAFNVVYSFVALCVAPLDTIILDQATLLSYMIRVSSGR